MRAAALLPLLLAGCASTPTAPPLDPGPMPSRAQAERAVKALLLPRLKDPDSLKQFGMAEPIRTEWRTGLLVGNEAMAGWLLCFEYNAKNSYGAYTGLQRDGYVFRNSGPDLQFLTIVDLTARGGARCPP
jgi:hypothetical protein